MIPSHIDRKEAFRYMGLHGKPGEVLAELADIWEKRLLSGVSPRFVYKVYPLEAKPEGLSCPGCSLLLPGADIAAHLQNCNRAALLCATLGMQAEQLRRTAKAHSAAEEMLADALENALIEQVCDMAQDKIAADLPEYYHTWRFSPGYGDLPLSVQADFLAAVNAEKRLGVTLSEGGMLVPSKSVTAVIGLSETPVPREKMGCGRCNMRKTCPYRAKGEHCR